MSLCESVNALHLHCPFSPKAFTVWDFFNRPICSISFHLRVCFFLNQQVYLMASLDAKAAKGELFQKLGAWKWKPGASTGQVASALTQLLLQDKDSVGLFLENCSIHSKLHKRYSGRAVEIQWFLSLKKVTSLGQHKLWILLTGVRMDCGGRPGCANIRRILLVKQHALNFSDWAMLVWSRQ